MSTDDKNLKVGKSVAYDVINVPHYVWTVEAIVVEELWMGEIDGEELCVGAILGRSRVGEQCVSTV